MIVKNEELMLAQCLNSVKDLVNEIIIVDTGSTDRTKEIAASFGAKVYDFTWINDFAAARNASLKHATGDWILVLDADEVIAKEDHLKIKALLDNPETIAYYLLQRTYTNNTSVLNFVSASKKNLLTSGCKGWFDCAIIRLFRNRKGITFKGEVHEVVDESINQLGNKCQLTPLAIHHYAERKDESSIINKRGSYRELCEQKVKSDPQNAQAHLQLGTAYKMEGAFSKAEDAYQEALRLDSTLFTPSLDLAVCLQKQQKWDEAITAYQKAIEKKLDSAEAHFGMGFCYIQKNELVQAIHFFELAIKYNPIYLDAYVNLGAIYEKTNNLDKAGEMLAKALHIDSKCARAYYNLGVVWEKAGNLQKAILCYEKSLDFGYTKEGLAKRIEAIKTVILSQ